MKNQKRKKIISSIIAGVMLFCSWAVIAGASAPNKSQTVLIEGIEYSVIDGVYYTVIDGVLYALLTLDTSTVITDEKLLAELNRQASDSSFSGTRADPYYDVDLSNGQTYNDHADSSLGTYTSPMFKIHTVANNSNLIKAKCTNFILPTAINLFAHYYLPSTGQWYQSKTVTFAYNLYTQTCGFLADSATKDASRIDFNFLRSGSDATVFDYQAFQ